MKFVTILLVCVVLLLGVVSAVNESSQVYVDNDVLFQGWEMEEVVYLIVGMFILLVLVILLVVYLIKKQ